MQGIIYLLLSVLLSVITVTFFKLFQRFNVSTFQAIVVNYVVCIVVGNSISEQPIIFTSFWKQPWFVYAAFLGFLFISVFYSIGLTAQRISASASMIAAKLSVVIPVTIALFIYNEPITLLKIIGIILSLVAVYLTRKTTVDSSPKNNAQWWLPVYVFIGSGMIDATLKWMQQRFIPPAKESDMLSTIFLVAFLIAIVMAFVKKERFTLKSLYWGIGLGIPNYFCMFFLVKSLSFFQASIIFPINNIAIVVCTALVSIIAFHEKMSKQNWAGLLLAVVSIACIAAIS